MTTDLSWIWVGQVLLMILVSILGTVLGGWWLLRHSNPKIEVHVIEVGARSFDEVRHQIETRNPGRVEWRYTPQAAARLGLKEESGER